MNCKKINVGIDASNIASGGGLTNLVQMLAAAVPSNCGVGFVHIWISDKIASRLPIRDWLIVHTPKWCARSLSIRVLSQQFLLPNLVKMEDCDILFAPGGTLPLRCAVPTVSMSQNMLPFEPDRAVLFGKFSWMRLKMKLLRFSHGRSFQRACGVIFLSRYSQTVILNQLGGVLGSTTLIPHGVEQRFSFPHRKKIDHMSMPDRPLRLLYVSMQLPYKHQLEVIQAVYRLRQLRVSVVLQMVGCNSGKYGDAVRRLRMRIDPEQNFIYDFGQIEFDQIHDLYQQADAFVYASSCENLPNILIEAMSAGLPIVCSDRGPMPEVLGDAGLYFNPESPDSLVASILRLLSDSGLAEDLARRASLRADLFSWAQCAKSTLDFLVEVVHKNSSRLSCSSTFPLGLPSGSIVSDA